MIAYFAFLLTDFRRIRMLKSLPAVAILVPLIAAFPAAAQDGLSHRDLRRATDAAILSDLSEQRRVERAARRQPYIPVATRGSIRTAAAARDACAVKALQQIGHAGIVLGRPDARTMSTGWEVEGEVGHKGDRDSIPFVCSVRNGSVTGILLRR
jgi:hypothetical protein